MICRSGGRDASSDLHHVLWDKQTQEKIGNGRFIGRQFDDHGKIYPGDTALTAAMHTLERLSSLGASLYSYTVQEDGRNKMLTASFMSSSRRSALSARCDSRVGRCQRGRPRTGRRH